MPVSANIRETCSKIWHRSQGSDAVGWEGNRRSGVALHGHASHTYPSTGEAHPVYTSVWGIAFFTDRTKTTRYVILTGEVPHRRDRTQTEPDCRRRWKSSPTSPDRLWISKHAEVPTLAALDSRCTPSVTAELLQATPSSCDKWTIHSAARRREIWHERVTLNPSPCALPRGPPVGSHKSGEKLLGPPYFPSPNILSRQLVLCS